MAKKYTVCANGKFIGHYHGKTPEEALNRGIDRYKALFPDFEVSSAIVTKNGEVHSFIKGV